MKIKIDNKNEIMFGDRRMIYDLYHLDSPHYEKYLAPTLGGVMKNVILDWATILETQRDCDIALVLPYAFDDHWIECLESQSGSDLQSCNSLR